MMAFLGTFQSPIWQRLAITLGHFLWQGLLIAVIAAVLMRFFRRTSVRYIVGLGGIVAMLIAACVTFAVTEATPQFSDSSHPPATTIRHSETPRVSVFTPPPTVPDSFWMRSQPYLLSVWAVGVLLFATRLFIGMGGVMWLRRGATPASAEWQHTLHRVGQRLDIKRRVTLRTHPRVRDAAAAGFWRPFVVVPAAWIGGLSPDVLEAVIAHELAHIRRWDLWANLFQRVVETLFFYHPAVWWLSRRVRREREKCCDEQAAHAVGGRLLYAKALETVAQFRGRPVAVLNADPYLATCLGGKKMAMLERVRHILRSPDGDSGWGRLTAGAMAIAIPVAIWAAASYTMADDPKERPSEARRDRERGETPNRGIRNIERRERIEREIRRDGDRPRERDRRDGEDRPRDRRDGERPPRSDFEPDRRPPMLPSERRDGDRRRDDARERDDRPRREGDRPRGEDRERDARSFEDPFDGRRRDGDRPRGERRIREIPALDAPFDPPRRDGDRPRVPGGDDDFEDRERRIDFDRARERDIEVEVDRRRIRNVREPEDRRPRNPNDELIDLIRDLRREVQELRREVQGLREGGPRPRGPENRVRDPERETRIRIEPLEKRPDVNRRIRIGVEREEAENSRDEAERAAEVAKRRLIELQQEVLKQKERAEQERRRAEEILKVAKQRALEAEKQRAIAENQRAKAEAKAQASKEAALKDATAAEEAALNAAEEAARKKQEKNE